MTERYDIIIFGSGIAGLYVANRLQRQGLQVLVIEKDKLGGIQTLASQGMIHGGQKYVLQGKRTAAAKNVAAMVERWESNFGGWGDIDLSAVKILSSTQILFTARKISLLARLALFVAARLVNGQTKWLGQGRYELAEKVVDIKSLVTILAKNLKISVLQGNLTELSPDGQCVVSGLKLSAQAIIITAGIGNEDALKLINLAGEYTQRRPLRQIMVKPMPTAFFGHGVEGKPKPRVTITSHPLENGYVWYLGGGIAEQTTALPEDKAIEFAKKEMQEIFPDIDFKDKEWASWYGDRAEAIDPKGDRPEGSAIHQRGRILFCWPTKLTLVPDLSDKILEWLRKSEVQPQTQADKPRLPSADLGNYPWEGATWHK